MRKYLLTIVTAMMSVMAIAQEQAPAFPGAEGHGRYTTGGRGATKVIHVTNLNNSGTGSFRSAVSGTAKKIIVFDVGGIIPLASDVSIGANTTILGQTAPYPGITLRYYTVRPNGNNIIMRFIRIRRGEEKNVNDGADATWARNFKGMILDHCSFSWSIDEIASFYDNRNFTMQWCTIGEALANPVRASTATAASGVVRMRPSTTTFSATCRTACHVSVVHATTGRATTTRNTAMPFRLKTLISAIV